MLKSRIVLVIRRQAQKVYELEDGKFHGASQGFRLGELEVSIMPEMPFMRYGVALSIVQLELRTEKMLLASRLFLNEEAKVRRVVRGRLGTLSQIEGRYRC